MKKKNIFFAFIVVSIFGYSVTNRGIIQRRLTEPDTDTQKIVVANNIKNKLDSIVEDSLDEVTDTTTTIDTLRNMTEEEVEKQLNETDSINMQEESLPSSYFPNKYKFAIPKSAYPLTKNLSNPNNPTKGLEGRHIALWQSHGLYYKQSQEKWRWQRGNLFQTREDLYTQSYVLPFIVPMLENAGANVLLPRERDIQTVELIIDNDKSSLGCTFDIQNGKNIWIKSSGNGFANYKTSYRQGENPFRDGSYLQTFTVSKKDSASKVQWNLDIPKKGVYAVYVSYKTFPNSSKDAVYTVYHDGGETQYAVNQTMGGGTWIYLGSFLFDKGKNQNSKIVLSNKSSDVNKIITADAIKIGGGMGNISRKRSDLITKKTIKIPYKKRIKTKSGKRKTVRRYRRKVITNVKHFYNYSTSNMPRFTEGARYWLQWAGMPDSVYSRTKGQDDYSDDFQSRGFWVNYLAGGSVIDPSGKGLNIPIDMSLALHTDAGTTTDTIIGTLAIHTVKTKEGRTVYKNGVSRWVGRDLSDMVQTQVVNDIRATYDSKWTRRQLWNRSYSESRVPEVPALLLELLSHQNFPDMRYGLDPRFQFIASRAIYKGILKFLAQENNFDYVVQPLPVETFSTQFTGNDEVVLKWKPVEDPLEKTATPKGYIVYTRVDSSGFNNGEYVNTATFKKKIDRNKIYSFKVEAVNEGGKSFPSEILSVCKASNDSTVVLIVNGFNRISAPASFEIDNLSGFNSAWDAGVPYIRDYKTTGYQFEFNKFKPYLSDENTGHGNSYTNLEGKVIAGNTFDYPYMHGLAIKKAGYSFVSCSENAIENGDIKMDKYPVVDLILGKERRWTSLNANEPPVFKTFTPAMRKAIIHYTDLGGNFFVSGANVVSDLVLADSTTNLERKFIEKTLKIKWAADKIDGISSVSFTVPTMKNFSPLHLSFYSAPNETSYFVESPDLIEPADAKAIEIAKYDQDGVGAGIAYKGKYGVCALGFPFETIKREEDRAILMKNILTFFLEKERK